MYYCVKTECLRLWDNSISLKLIAWKILFSFETQIMYSSEIQKLGVHPKSLSEFERKFTEHYKLPKGIGTELSVCSSVRAHVCSLGTNSPTGSIVGNRFGDKVSSGEHGWTASNGLETKSPVGRRVGAHVSALHTEWPGGKTRQSPYKGFGDRVPSEVQGTKHFSSHGL